MFVSYDLVPSHPPTTKDTRISLARLVLIGPSMSESNLFGGFRSYGEWAPVFRVERKHFKRETW